MGWGSAAYASMPPPCPRSFSSPAPPVRAGFGAAIAVLGAVAHGHRDATLSLAIVAALASLAGLRHMSAVAAALRAAERDVAGLAAREERLRLARDLHDAVKQGLFAAALELGTARQPLGSDPAAAGRHLDAAAAAIAPGPGGARRPP
jgi:signal transduction histidine kinase